MQKIADKSNEDVSLVVATTFSPSSDALTTYLSCTDSYVKCYEMVLTFAIVDLDNVIYYCELPTHRVEISFQQIPTTLRWS